MVRAVLSAVDTDPGSDSERADGAYANRQSRTRPGPAFPPPPRIHATAGPLPAAARRPPRLATTGRRSPTPASDRACGPAAGRLLSGKALLLTALAIGVAPSAWGWLG